MSVREDITVDWESSPRIIEVAAPSDKLMIQDLYDTLRYLGAQPEAMDNNEIVEASGKEALGEYIFVGLTVTLKNAKVKFEDREGSEWVRCDILGGNLVAVDSYGDFMDAVEPSSYVTVSRTSASSATIIMKGTEELVEEIINTPSSIIF